MLPSTIQKFLIQQKKGQGFFCVELDSQFNIIQYFGNAKELGLQAPHYEMPIAEFLPILLTESFATDFHIPFYNLSQEHVCHIDYLTTKTKKYVVLLDKSEIFQITQKYQQFAHEDNISKNKFKRLSEQLHKAKHQLNKSNQEKATLIAMLSHELGTPLTSILGYSELLMNEGINIKKGLSIINRNAVYLKQMIENTLIFGRTEAGGIQKHLDEISLHELFSTIETIVSASAQSKLIKLQIDTSSRLTIAIDITRTKQILINLLNNAIKYTNEGYVELKFSSKNNQYVFSVIDSGIGIPENQQENIFNPWERVNESKATGAGIGLFISQKLAQAIGAQLRLKYSSKEFGSIFQLSIPIEQPPKASTFSDTDIQQACKNKAVLIIDDDPDIVDLLEAFLYVTGIKIYTALDMLKAQAILKNNRIDIILTDFYLGTIRADAYVAKFNKQYNLPIVLMTALPSSQIQQQYKAQGFDRVLAKPINSKILIHTIVQLLAAKAQDK